MEEERIKDLFKDYAPDLSSSMDFMQRLERNLDAVELIHRENAAVMKRNRLAVAIASCAGFLTGVIFTLLFPYINSLIQSLSESIQASCNIPYSLNGMQLIAWLAVGAASVFVALNTYSLTNLLLSNKHTAPSSPTER
ncbi:MAG: hypothetical protein HDS38_08330 [Bacteroides sp.]|nr:hypothetical protein [Bacteroides sp.]